MRQRKLSLMDENSISMIFDSMTIKTYQSSYSYDHGFYNLHRESSSDMRNEDNFFGYKVFISYPPQVNVDLSIHIH